MFYKIHNNDDYAGYCDYSRLSAVSCISKLRKKEIGKGTVSKKPIGSRAAKNAVNANG